jgi:hypothetical protein
MEALVRFLFVIPFVDHLELSESSSGLKVVFCIRVLIDVVFVEPVLNG